MSAALLTLALSLAALACSLALGSLIYLLCRLDANDDLRTRLDILEGLVEPGPAPESESEPAPKDTTPC